MSARVAIFLPSLRGGGAERVAVNLAGDFSRRGLRVDLLLARAEGPYLERLPSTVRVVDFAASRVAWTVPKLMRYLRAERPRAVLSMIANANVCAAWARRAARSPARLVLREPNTVSQVVAHPRSLRERSLPWFLRRFYPWADAVVVNSHGSARDLIETVGIPAAKVHVIPNPIDLDAVRAAAQEPPPLALSTEPPTIVAVGRLTPQKGYEDLIRAFQRVRSARSVRLIILGEGEDRAALERLVRELDLADSVALPGFCDNPWSVIARAALFVLSSRWEGQPNALMEAVALGVPIVATDCPSGPREILLDGQLGALVSVGDPVELAAAMLAALSKPGDREALRQRAEDFAVRRVAAEYLRVMGIEPPAEPAAGSRSPGGSR